MARLDRYLGNGIQTNLVVPNLREYLTCCQGRNLS